MSNSEGEGAPTSVYRPESALGIRQESGRNTQLNSRSIADLGQWLLSLAAQNGVRPNAEISAGEFASAKLMLITVFLHSLHSSLERGICSHLFFKRIVCDLFCL